MNFHQILGIIWPPYGCRRAQKALSKKASSLAQEWDSVVEALKFSLDGIEEGEFVSFARQVSESENKRREGLEQKAGVIIQASGVAAAIVALIPALASTSGWNLPPIYAGIVSILYLIAVVHFWFAMYYATSVRRVSPVVLPSTDEFIDFAKNTKVRLRFYQGVFEIARAKVNEPLLSGKSNHLVVAESLFRRGLAVLSAGATVAVICHILRDV